MAVGIQRAILPAFLFVLGAGMVAGGSLFHVQQVVGQMEATAKPRTPPPMPPGMEQPFWMNDTAPGEQPQAPQLIAVLIDESEFLLTKEVSVGGVRLEGGQIKRTYIGDTPSLCPT